MCMSHLIRSIALSKTYRHLRYVLFWKTGCVTEGFDEGKSEVMRLRTGEEDFTDFLDM